MWPLPLPPMFYVLTGSLTSPFNFNNSVETATPPTMLWTEINLWKSVDLLLGSNVWPLAPSAGCWNGNSSMPYIPVSSLWQIHWRQTVLRQWSCMLAQTKGSQRTVWCCHTNGCTQTSGTLQKSGRVVGAGICYVMEMSALWSHLPCLSRLSQ